MKLIQQVIASDFCHDTCFRGWLWQKNCQTFPEKYSLDEYNKRKICNMINILDIKLVNIYSLCILRSFGHFFQKLGVKNSKKWPNFETNFVFWELVFSFTNINEGSHLEVRYTIYWWNLHMCVGVVEQVLPFEMENLAKFIDQNIFPFYYLQKKLSVWLL